MIISHLQGRGIVIVGFDYRGRQRARWEIRVICTRSSQKQLDYYDEASLKKIYIFRKIFNQYI